MYVKKRGGFMRLKETVDYKIHGFKKYAKIINIGMIKTAVMQKTKGSSSETIKKIQDLRTMVKS